MGSGLTDDEVAVDREVLAAQAEEREISDGCARIIASWCYTGDSTLTYVFVSTGAIVTDDPCKLWRALASDYPNQPPRMQRALDCLGTYLVHRTNHGTVPGWHALPIARPDEPSTA